MLFLFLFFTCNDIQSNISDKSTTESTNNSIGVHSIRETFKVSILVADLVITYKSSPKLILCIYLNWPKYSRSVNSHERKAPREFCSSLSLSSCTLYWLQVAGGTRPNWLQVVTSFCKLQSIWACTDSN